VFHCQAVGGANTEGTNFKQLVSRKVKTQLHENSILIRDMKETKRLRWFVTEIQYKYFEIFIS
jgi:hypothetical protein